MRFILFLLVAALPFYVSASSDAQAGQAFSHCKNAESTADSMACVKKRHEEAQIRLSTIFENILNTQAKEGLQGLHLAHNEWISYRDKECRWEMGQTENESMRRIEELACLTTLTEQRAALLEKSHEHQQENEIKEYSAFPRWMNVVAKESPEVFWRYGDFLNLDLDCDGQDEAVMVGQSVITHEVFVEGSDPYKLKTVLAVSENPVSGRPQTRIIPLDLEKSEAATHPCDLNIALSAVDYPPNLQKPAAGDLTNPADQSDDVEEEKQCVQALQISGRSCQSVLLLWDGSDFTFNAVQE